MRAMYGVSEHPKVNQTKPRHLYFTITQPLYLRELLYRHKSAYHTARYTHP